MGIDAGRRNVITYCSMGLILSLAACNCDSGQPPISRIAGQLDVEPAVLDFGQVPLGATKSLIVRAKNSGDDGLTICLVDSSECSELSRFEPEGPFSWFFEALDDDGNFLLQSGATHEFAVRFNPTVEGSFEATLILAHTGRNDAVEIPVVGVGIAPNLTIDPQSIDFGNVTVDSRAEVEVTLTNDTPFPQPVDLGPIAQSAVIFGTSNGDLDTPDGSPLHLEVPANNSVVIKVWFAPLEEGEQLNTLPLSFCPTCSADISLRGVGIKPQFELDPPFLDFGSMDEGMSATQSFIVRNIGNVGLELREVRLGAATPPHFTVTPMLAGGTLPLMLDAPDPSGLCPVGLTCELTVEVTYTAQAPGSVSGTVDVFSNAWAPAGQDNTGYVQLQAVSNGPDINPLPPAVNFGTVGIGGTPATKVLLLENAGNTDLTISGVQLTSPTPEITMTPPTGGPTWVVTPGSSIQATLSYLPQDAGADTAQITVTSDDRDEGNLVIDVDGFGGVPTACSIAVAPTQVTFGLVERGRVATLPVELRNGGAQPCNVSNIRLTGDPSFTVVSGAQGPVNIAPGSTHRIEVEYAPTAYGMHSTILELDADDPAQPMIQVPIAGSSAESDLLVTPSSLDFNVVPVTCRSPNRAITIYNTGTAAATINNVYLDASTSPEFELQPFTTPATIPAGGSVVINVRYHPADIGADNGVLFIETSESVAPIAVPLSGEGQITPTITDNFQQLPTPQADILFVVDDSCSMDDEQAALGPQLGAFLGYADSEGIDYQIAVTTTDVFFSNPTGSYQGGKQGQFVSINGTKMITRTTPNGATVFNQMVTSLGDTGSGDEQGLEAAYLALSDPLINGWNAGFLRQDAALAIIIVSDEDDKSPRPTSFYENFFRNIKGFQNGSLFSLSGVIVLPTQSPGCSSGGAEQGIRYANVAQNTGGIVQSICTANWGQTLATIGLNTFGLKRKFFLSSQPVPTTIAVMVNGVSIPAVTPGGQVNWSYDSQTNSVEFSTNAVPDAGSSIDITYTVACLP